VIEEMKIAEQIAELRDFVGSLIPEAQKFEEKGNATAGTRVTTGMMKAKKLAADIRKRVFEIKG
jgi:hypothetical protein